MTYKENIMNSQYMMLLVQFSLFIVPFLFAICFHEWAHGWTAKKKGDNTAEILGRLTLNPAAHIDILGTLVIPSLALWFGWPLFGWAKPVPVNPRNLKNVKNDMFWIAAAGPLSNILLAFVGSGVLYLLLHAPFPAKTDTLMNYYQPLSMMLVFFIKINLVLAFFNLLPLHPLDGGKILARFLPTHVNHYLENHQGTSAIVLLCLAVTGGLTFIYFPVNWLASLMIPERFL